jgi:ParB family chromosome partitioning protein
MQVFDISVDSITAAHWNPNQMDDLMTTKLRESIRRFGLVVPLVVRELTLGRYETIGGAQRLVIAQELELDRVPCVVVDADDLEARLLGQCLNRIAGDDDLGLKAELIRELLDSLPQEEVLKLLPETASSLSALASLGQDDMASHLMAWQEAQQARLKHMQFQLTSAQLEVVDEALARVMQEAKSTGGDSPNVRGTALYLLCKRILEIEEETP